MGMHAKSQGVVGAEVVVRHVRPVGVASRRYVMTSMTAHGYMNNLEEAVQVAARELFDSDAEERVTYERQSTATNSNVSRKPLARKYTRAALPSDYRCWMTGGLSLGTAFRLLGHQCSPHIVNGCRP